MPCTLEPWEIAYEERRANKEKYGKEVTDSEMLTRIACEFARQLEEGDRSILRSNGFSKEAID